MFFITGIIAMCRPSKGSVTPLLFVFLVIGVTATAAAEPVAVEGQPLAANVNRVIQALDSLGSPLPGETTEKLQLAAKARDAAQLQKLLDPHVLFVVSINPESRVKVQRGPAPAM